MTDLEVALEAARAGGAIVAGAFGNIQQAEFKGAVDPVTAVDHAAEDAILRVLHDRRPADAVLAEERGGSRDLSGRHWIVDPLDGTVNFLHGIPQVSIAVGLYEDGRPLAGVVFDPLRREEFAAATGAGATLNGRPIGVSTRPLTEAVIATGFPYDRRKNGETYAHIVGKVVAQARGIRRFGSAALDLSWVAAGRLDGYWEFGLAPWDIAAAMVIVLEAGGLVSDAAGRASTLFDHVYVAGGEPLHGELRALLSAHMPEGWPANR